MAAETIQPLTDAIVGQGMMSIGGGGYGNLIILEHEGGYVLTGTAGGARPFAHGSCKGHVSPRYSL